MVWFSGVLCFLEGDFEGLFVDSEMDYIGRLLFLGLHLGPCSDSRMSFVQLGAMYK